MKEAYNVYILVRSALATTLFGVPARIPTAQEIYRPLCNTLNLRADGNAWLCELNAGDVCTYTDLRAICEACSSVCKAMNASTLQDLAKTALLDLYHCSLHPLKESDDVMRGRLLYALASSYRLETKGDIGLFMSDIESELDAFRNLEALRKKYGFALSARTLRIMVEMLKRRDTEGPIDYVPEELYALSGIAAVPARPFLAFMEEFAAAEEAAGRDPYCMLASWSNQGIVECNGVDTEMTDLRSLWDVAGLPGLMSPFDSARLPATLESAKRYLLDYDKDPTCRLTLPVLWLRRLNYVFYEDNRHAKLIAKDLIKWISAELKNKKRRKV